MTKKSALLQILSLLLLAGISSCGQDSDLNILSDTDSPDDGGIHFTKFESEGVVELPSNSIEIIGKPASIVSTQDYLMILDRTKSPWVSVFDKQSLELLGKIVPQGRGPGESINPAKLLSISEANTFWLFDGLMQRFQLFEIKAALLANQEDRVYEPEREFLLKDSLRGSSDPSLIRENKFVTTTYSHDDCRFFYFDQNSQIVQKVGNLPPAKSNWPEQGEEAYFPIAAMYYNAKLTAHPTEDWVAVGYFNTDVIEIYKEGQLVQKVAGPEDIEIEKEIKEEVEGIYVAMSTSETIDAYMDLYAIGEYIFALYKGKDMEGTNTIHVFDWDGRPMKKITFTQDIVTFWGEKMIDGSYVGYIINAEEGSLDRFDFTL